MNSLYANTLHTKRHTQKHFRFCGTLLQFQPKCRKLLAETKKFVKCIQMNFSRLHDDEMEELGSYTFQPLWVSGSTQ